MSMCVVQITKKKALYTRETQLFFLDKTANRFHYVTAFDQPRKCMRFLKSSNQNLALFKIGLQESFTF